jgi:hypothetical protein
LAVPAVGVFLAGEGAGFGGTDGIRKIGIESAGGCQRGQQRLQTRLQVARNRLVADEAQVFDFFVVVSVGRLLRTTIDRFSAAAVANGFAGRVALAADAFHLEISNAITSFPSDYLQICEHKDTLEQSELWPILI